MREKDDRTVRVKGEELSSSAFSAAVCVFGAAVLAVLSVTSMFGAMGAPLFEPYRDVYRFAWSAGELALIVGGILLPLPILGAIVTFFVLGRCRFDRRVESVRWGWSWLNIFLPLFFLSVAVSFLMLSRSVLDDHMELLSGADLRKRHSTMFVVAAVCTIVLGAVATWLAHTLPKFKFDWTRSPLCRRCGYDRGESVSVCPECGEKAHG